MSVNEEALLCNLERCRRRVGDFAWVTSCAHLFCDEDGARAFRTGPVACPACGTLPRGNLGVARVALNPSEEHKSMVLAGLGPDVIQEICSRALSFWMFQMNQERLYQEHVATKLRTLTVHLEGRVAQEIQSRQTEVITLKRQMSLEQSELAKTKRRYADAAEKLQERDREQKKLQFTYDRLCRQISADDVEGRCSEWERARKAPGSSPFVMRFATSRTWTGVAGSALSDSTTPPRRSEQTDFLPPLFKGSAPGGSRRSDGFPLFLFPAPAKAPLGTTGTPPVTPTTPTREFPPGSPRRVPRKKPAASPLMHLWT